MFMFTIGYNYPRKLLCLRVLRRTRVLPPHFQLHYFQVSFIVYTPCLSITCDIIFNYSNGTLILTEYRCQNSLLLFKPTLVT